jgi:hypothetical protein
MKGKKYSTEEKIRILRQADGGRSIDFATTTCRETTIISSSSGREHQHNSR